MPTETSPSASSIEAFPSAERPLAWITGAGGLLGNQFVSTAPTFAPAWRVRGLSRTDADLLDPSAVSALFQRERPHLVIHCAALSKSPACEANPELARRSNVEATHRLLELAGSIPFVFFSTDLVFDGERGNYVEEDQPNPLSVYAETKVQAEGLVRKHSLHTIVRISLNGGKSPSGNSAFNEEMKKGWAEGKSFNLFTDEFRNPMAASVTTRAVWELVNQNAHGTYHLCGSERLSRYEIGRLLAERHPGLKPNIVSSSRKSYSGPPRPRDTSLNCAKVQSRLSFQLPRFSEWLKTNSEPEF